MATSDGSFAGSIPKLYETYLVPLIFESYAGNLASQLRSRPLTRVLEIAAGTGVVTRRLASELPGQVSIIATDLNQAMLDQAAAVGTSRPVEWRQADAMKLPFEDEMFDAVVCQFGVMFFPDKPKAYAEARRVLRQGGLYIFNVWDKIDTNEFAETVEKAMATVFPKDPPRFLSRTPYGYYDASVIEQDLAGGGFKHRPRLATVTERSCAAIARIPALAYCQGTPLRNEIESRDATRLAEATETAARAVAQRFGDGPIEGKIQAHVISIEK